MPVGVRVGVVMADRHRLNGVSSGDRNTDIMKSVTLSLFKIRHIVSKRNGLGGAISTVDLHMYVYIMRSVWCIMYLDNVNLIITNGGKGGGGQGREREGRGEGGEREEKREKERERERGTDPPV